MSTNCLVIDFIPTAAFISSSMPFLSNPKYLDLKSPRVL
nr:MAG TPA: hypothetical protein [Bacteriophage sp.]